MSAFLADDPLARAGQLLTERLAQLEGRIRAGEETAWVPYLATVTTLLAVRAHTAPGAHGELLKTSEMAARLGIASKTLLRRKKNGTVTPALQAGRLIRWKGSEAMR